MRDVRGGQACGPAGRLRAGADVHSRLFRAWRGGKPADAPLGAATGGAVRVSRKDVTAWQRSYCRPRARPSGHGLGHGAGPDGRSHRARGRRDAGPGDRPAAVGAGSDPVERGRIDRFRITGAGEGAPVAQLFRRMRLGGQVIWATQFVERAATSGGGKGAPPQPKTNDLFLFPSASPSPCARARSAGSAGVWADGVETGPEHGVDARLHRRRGPDARSADGGGWEGGRGRGGPPIAAPPMWSSRDLDLTPFGNRVPQFAFEVARPAQPEARDVARRRGPGARGGADARDGGICAVDAQHQLPDRLWRGAGRSTPSAEGGGSDFTRALQQVRDVLPGLRSVSVIYSWFGDDLRAGLCRVKTQGRGQEPRRCRDALDRRRHRTRRGRGTGAGRWATDLWRDAGGCVPDRGESGRSATAGRR